MLPHKPKIMCALFVVVIIVCPCFVPDLAGILDWYRVKVGLRLSRKKWMGSFISLIFRLWRLWCDRSQLMKKMDARRKR